MTDNTAKADLSDNATWLAVMRAIDKYDRLGEQGVRDLLTRGRKDDSGAWTPGIGLTSGQADIICYCIGLGQTSQSNAETLRRIRRFFAIATMPKEGLARLHAALERMGLIDESTLS